jgi:phosphoglycerate dehydrogenase-like enzyme
VPVHKMLFLTERSLRHQELALRAAPPELAVTMLRDATRAQVLDLIPDVEFLISERSGILDADLIAAGKKLRLIQRLGSLTYDIDLNAARTAGIPVCYWPIRTCVMLAEHMLMQLLMVAKRAREAMHVLTQVDAWDQKPQKVDEDYFAYNWSERHDIHGLYQSTVGILGFGEVGAELARRLQGFGCTVLYTKRRPLPAPAEAELRIQYADIATLRAESDYLCVLLPYHPATYQMVDAEFLAGMKPRSSVVTCSGGLDEGAVAQAIQAGHLYGAAADTFVYEPIRGDNPLLTLAADPAANVVLTPHTGSGTITDWDRLRAEDYANAVSLLADQPLRYRVA